MQAKDVFTPGRFPTLTYVDDHLVDKRRQLEDTLDAGSMLISISVPSKSGKTVFIEQCLGRTNLIQITGAGVKSARSENATFNLTNSAPYTIHIKLFSQSRHGWQWPSSKRHWILDDAKQHTLTAGNCQPGEKICYGGSYKNEGNLKWTPSAGPLVPGC